MRLRLIVTQLDWLNIFIISLISPALSPLYCYFKSYQIQEVRDQRCRGDQHKPTWDLEIEFNYIWIPIPYYHHLSPNTPTLQVSSTTDWAD